MQSSHLTRAVFRALIASRPYAVADCCRYAQSTRLLRRPRNPFMPLPKRSLFTALLGTVDKTFEGAQNTPRNLELALAKLVELLRARRTNSRAPSDTELIDAFKFIFRVRLESNRRLTRNEVFLVTETFRYFLEKGLVRDDNETTSIQQKDLHIILSALALSSGKERFRTDSKSLATLVFRSLPANANALDISTGSPKNKSSSLLSTYITVLSRTGSAVEALRLLNETPDLVIRSCVKAWIEILKGLVKESKEAEIEFSIAQIEKLREKISTTDFEEILVFLSSQCRLREARKIYDLQIHNGVSPTTKQLQRLIEMCAQIDVQDWGTDLATELIKRKAEADVLGSLLIWLSSRRLGRKEIAEIVENFVHDAGVRNLNIHALNSLYKFGLLQKRSDITAAALDLAELFELRLNGETYTLQLQQVLETGDITQASLIYEQMALQDVPSDDSDIPTLNRFLAALAFTSKPPYALLMRIVDTILERNADFDAEALAGLCKVFLERDELEDATGMLRHRADFYPQSERSRIAAIFSDFILNQTVSDQRAYNAYEIFKIAFPETPIERRLPIMQSFFDRNRPDLACQIFADMRQREDTDARPDASAYARCFAGIAKCRDVDGLQVVYNMLKLDLEVELTTRVRNGLMLAYIACNQPFKSMIDHFWRILDSREGPSYSTFEIGLRACETWVPQGGYEARKIIAVMQAWNLEITKELYECYIGALAGQSEFEYAVELIEEMESDTGEAPDAITIGTFYNAIPWQYRKDEVEKWAKKTYPELWEDLLTYGDEIDEEWEIRYFKIPRDIEIDDAPLFASGKYDPQISKQALKTLEPPGT